MRYRRLTGWLTYIACSSLMNNEVSWTMKFKTFAYKSDLTEWSLQAKPENYGYQSIIRELSWSPQESQSQRWRKKSRKEQCCLGVSLSLSTGKRVGKNNLSEKVNFIYFLLQKLNFPFKSDTLIGQLNFPNTFRSRLKTQGNSLRFFGDFCLFICLFWYFLRHF